MTHAEGIQTFLKAFYPLDEPRFHCIDIPGHKVEAIDSNGAGDMFAGAVLYCLSQGQSLEDGAKFGCYAASKVVRHVGPRLSKEEYKKIKVNYFYLLKKYSDKLLRA